MDPIGGGQFKQAVQQMIEAEKQPIKNLEARKAKEDTRLKLFQEFKSKFSGFDKVLNEISSFKKFRDLKVDLGNGENQVSVTIDKGKAEPGQYLIKIDELAARTSTLSNGFENPDEPFLGIGFINLNLENGESTEIYINENTSSLQGIASAINNTSNSPIRASVIRDDSDPELPWRLLMVGKKEGSTNNIEFPEFYFMDSQKDFYIDEDHESKNASLSIDGFSIESENNDIPNFLPGVNLHLKQANPENPFFITITEDYQKISGKLKGLIDQTNQVLQFITSQNAIDQSTDTTTTFGGDSSLQAVEYKIRNIIHQPYFLNSKNSENASHFFINQIGIEFEKTGQITFREEKFNKALEDNFEGIAQVISGPSGLAQQFRSLIDSYMRSSDGFLTIKEKGLKSRIKDIDDQIDRKTIILEKKKQSLTDKFSRLQATLGQLQSQQQYLSAALPAGGSGGNVISQLMGG